MESWIRSLRILVFVAAITPCLVAGGEKKPQFPEGSADNIMALKGGAPVTNKVYVLGSRIRAEVDFGGDKLITITDIATKEAWRFTSARCRKEAFAPWKHPSPWPVGSDLNEEFIGPETIDGHPTRKYRVTATIDDERVVTYVWRATDLGGWVVRATNDAGEFVARVENVSLSRPDPKLFEPPANCES